MHSGIQENITTFLLGNKMDNFNYNTKDREGMNLAWNVTLPASSNDGECEMRVLLKYDSDALLFGGRNGRVARFITCDAAMVEPVEGFKRVHRFFPKDDKFGTESKWFPITNSGEVEVAVVLNNCIYESHDDVEVTVEIRRKK